MMESMHGHIADALNCSNSTVATGFLSPVLRRSTTPEPPFGVEEARRRSRANFPFQHGPHLTFSSIVKRALDPPGVDGVGSTKDDHLEHFLCVAPSQRLWAARNELEFGALHFDVPPTTEAPQGYDEIHLRNVFSHDIAFAVVKQNKVEAAIEAFGFAIDYSIADAHLLVIFEHLFQSPQSRRTSAHGSSQVSFQVYHNLGAGGGIQTQYWHRPSQSRLRLDEAVPGLAPSDCEALHAVYQKPCLVRRLEDVAVIKAWEVLTKETCTQWLAHKPDASTPYWFRAFVYDKGGASGDLSFDIDLVYQELPLNSVPLSCSLCRTEVEQEPEVAGRAEGSAHEWTSGDVRKAWLTVDGTIVSQ